MKTNKTAKAIRKEALECAKSADDMRNTPQHRDVFYVVSIILNGIADKLEASKGKTAT